MKYIQTALVTSAIALAAGAVSSSAWAQDEQEPPPPTPPAAAPPAQEDTGEEYPSGYFRVDHDSFNLQLWVGATHDVFGVDISSDIYVDSADFAEFDIGPSFSVGPAAFLPMVGIGFNWSQQRATNLIAPQLFTIVDLDAVYFESWIQAFLPSVFVSGEDNYLYTRNFLLYKASDHVHIGPQVEARLALNNTGDDVQAGVVVEEGRDTLENLPVGGRLNLVIGPADLLGLFLGYETMENGRSIVVDEQVDPTTGEITEVTEDRGLVGRFTYVHTW